MTPIQQLLSTFDSIVADESIPGTHRREWSKLRTLARKLAREKAKPGRPRVVDDDAVLRLHESGQTHAEIAETLGVGPATVNRALQRARGKRSA